MEGCDYCFWLIHVYVQYLPNSILELPVITPSSIRTEGSIPFLFASQMSTFAQKNAVVRNSRRLIRNPYMFWVTGGPRTMLFFPAFPLRENPCQSMEDVIDRAVFECKRQLFVDVETWEELKEIKRITF